MNSIKSQSNKNNNCGVHANNSSGSAAEDEDRKMRKLFVDKLNSSITEDDIYAVFSKHGDIEEVAKYQDRRAPTRYFAFVVYKRAKDCVKATHNPCPIIRGRKCACMLAAIGKQFSGYKFFVQKGLLSEEEKKNQVISNTQTPQANTSNSQQMITKRHSGKKRAKHKSNSNHKEQQQQQQPQPRSLPSFKENATNSGVYIVSNTPSTHLQYNMYPYPPNGSYSGSRVTTKSMHSNPSNTQLQYQPLPQTQAQQHYNAAQYAPKTIYVYKEELDEPRYRSMSYPYMQYQQHSNPNWHRYGQQGQGQGQEQGQYYQQQNYNHNRRYYHQPQPHSISYAQTRADRDSPQLRRRSGATPNIPNIVLPPMTQSVSYGHIERLERLENSRSNSYAPKLQSMPRAKPAVYRSQSARCRFTPSSQPRPQPQPQSHTAKVMPAAVADIVHDIPCPDLLMDDFASFEIGFTPSPPPCSPPVHIPAAKIKMKGCVEKTGYMDKLPVISITYTPPSFDSLEDAQKASDKDLEAGFTMLASPTPSVKTEYNDGEDVPTLDLINGK